MGRWRIILLVIIFMVGVMDLSGIINIPTVAVSVVVGILILGSIIFWIRKEKHKEKTADQENNK